MTFAGSPRVLHRSLIAFVLMLALTTASMIFSTSSHSAEGDSAGVKEVGTLPRFSSEALSAFGDVITPTIQGDAPGFAGGTLLGVPSAGQLWQLYPMYTQVQGGSTSPTGIMVRDLTTLQVVKTLVVPLPLKRGAGGQGGDWMHAIDGSERIFFLSAQDENGQGKWLIIEIDLRTFQVRTHALREPFSLPTDILIGFAPAAMEYDPFDKAILLLFGGIPSTSAANALTFVHRYELGTGNSGTRQIRSCSGPLTPTDSGLTSQVAGIVTREVVYFTCQRSGSIGAVVSIKRDELILPPTSDESIVAGPPYLETSFADPKAGRIFLITISGEIWAYDIATNSFVGVVAGTTAGLAVPRIGFGIDTATGRLFLQSKELGLGIAEGRFYPIPQARIYPEFKAEGQERIISDTKNNRVFVLTGTSGSRAAAYKIYDIGEAPVPPPPPDPDRNTVDIPEQPGVTEARYFGSGTGYGARVLIAKGLTAAPPAPALGLFAPTAFVIASHLNSKCGFTDRELVVGRVAKAEYDTGSTAAQAVGIDLDERTKLDLANTSRCDVQATSGGSGFQGFFATDPFREPFTENEPSIPWEREAAFCSSSEGGEPTSADSKNEGNSKGRVECPLPGGRLEAEAVGYLTGTVSVGKSSAHTEIIRDARGVVSKVVAEAQDIDIGGVVQIGRLTSVAESASNGRPTKGDMSTHRVTLQGVTIGDTALCTDNCQISEVLRALNLAGAGRVEFRSSSGLDHTLLEGSKRGASTAVQKSTSRQASDQALVGDRTTEVAALEMIVYNDNTSFGRARQIFQFAGVSTAATYNIALQPTGAGFDPNGGVGDVFEPLGGDGATILSGVDSLPPNVLAGNDGDGGIVDTIRRALKALVRGIRLFLTNPRHALLLFTAWALFGLPPVLSRRRRLLTAIRSE